MPSSFFRLFQAQVAFYVRNRAVFTSGQVYLPLDHAKCLHQFLPRCQFFLREQRYLFILSSAHFAHQNVSPQLDARGCSY